MNVNVSMWVKALQAIPRVTKEEWGRLDIISRWLIATRASVLIITFISVGVAGLLAIRDSAFNLGLWLLLAVGLLLAHATNNLLNREYVANGYTYTYQDTKGQQNTFNWFYPQATRNYLASVGVKF